MNNVRSQKATTALAIGAFIVGCVGLVLGAGEVTRLGRLETERWSNGAEVSQVLRAPLVAAELVEGQSALFEICADDAFESTMWREARVAVVAVRYEEEAAAFALEELLPRVRIQDGVGCLLVAQSDGIRETGEYAIRLSGARLSELRGVRVSGHIGGWMPLQLEGRSVALAFLGFLFLTVLLAFRNATFREHSGRSLAWVLVATAIVIGAVMGVGSAANSAGLAGSLGVLVGACMLVLLQLAASFALKPAELLRPLEGWKRKLAGALFALPLAFLFVLAGRLMSQLVPSTGIAPIESFVERPSGALAMGIVAVAAPVAEEAFFRGALFGALKERYGNLLAGLVCICLFAAVHLPQQWGAWGAFLSVTTLGVGMVILRVLTKSTAYCALVHLLHNALLSLPVLLAS